MKGKERRGRKGKCIKDTNGKEKQKKYEGRKRGQGWKKGLLVFRAGTAYTKLFGFRVGAPRCA